MGYVDKNLLQGEQVVYRAYIHWLIFLPAVLWLSAGIVLVGVLSHPLSEQKAVLFGIGGLFALIALFQFLKAWIVRSATELAVTTKRVILKTGLVRRDTLELNHSKVESFHVDQGVLGRVFDYGNLVINGTGGGKTPIRNIGAPLEFRRRAMEAIDAGQQR